MRKLIEFLVAKRHWLLFLFCEIISFVLIYHNNAYQHGIILSAANSITGSITSLSNSIVSYFDLQKANLNLIERNARLEMEVAALQEQLEEIKIANIPFGKVFLKDSILPDSLLKYDYITANVVNNSTIYMTNYITVNKGYKDGIRPDMGVVSPDGVVGIVKTVNKNYSVVISLLNVKLKMSCKVKNTNYFGSLSWKGGNVQYAYLEELPTHSVFQIGDTIVTSGYSAVFPPGIMVGVLESYDKQHDDNFFSLKVKLATDFQSLTSLCIIGNKNQNEQLTTEKEAKKND
ncbi:MAG: rod shape-determining protein MreC [Tannerella sp.]|jgi:rod shape-determining protein MreC|nr:rod shape-determining protein MreC [Tannerella sp.]